MDNKAPLISIVVVNYNGIKYLPKLIESIASQDYKNIEVIFVDNASSDESVSHVQINLPMAKIHLNKSNLGFAIANNQGVKLSSGKYLLILNNDTYFGRDFVSKLFNILISTGANAVAPLILFSKYYIEILITSSLPIYLSEKISKENTNIKNVIFPEGKKYIWLNGERHLEISNAEKIKVPIPELNQDLELQLSFILKNNTTTNKIQINKTEQFEMSSLNTEISVLIPAAYLANSKFQIINSKGLSIDNKTCQSKDISFGETYQPHSGTINAVGLSGCCFLITRQLLQNENLFDPSYFAYYEDVNFFLSLNKRTRGKNIVSLDTKLYHNVSSSFSKFENEKIYLIERNRLLTVKNNCSTFNWLKEWATFFLYAIYMNLGGNAHYGAHRKHIHRQVCIDLVKNRTIKELNSIFT